MISTLATTAGGSAAGAALPFAGAAITGLLEYKNASPHARATKFVNEVENPFAEALAEIVRLKDAGRTEEAAAMFKDAYAQYQAGVQQVREAGQYTPGAPKSLNDDIINQSLNNPKLWQTVDTLSGQLGMTRANGQLVSASMPGSGNSFVEGDNNPALVGSGLSPLDQVGKSIPGVGGGGSNPTTGGTAGASTAAASTGVAAVLGKIFGVNTSQGDQGIINDLIKIGVPVSAAVLSGVEASKAANVQADAANKSAQLIADSAKNSLDFEKQVYGDQQTQTAPYRAAGTAALDKIQALLGIGAVPADGSERPDPTAELAATPRYKLDFGEGIKAMNAANRGIVSGATIKAAERFGQGLADKTFDSNFGNLSTVAGFGQQGTAQNLNAGTNAVNTTTGINTNSATGIGNAQQDAAAARASGYGSGVGSQVLNEIQKQQLLKQLGY